MRVLVYGAGVLGSLYAVRLHESGANVTILARGDRLKSIRDRGVLVAEGDGGGVRSVAVPVTDRVTGGWDLILVLVRTHQVVSALDSLADVLGDVLLLTNWAGGPEPLERALGPGRLLLGFPNQGGVMDGDVVRYRPPSRLTRLVSMPIGEPDGRSTPRVERVLQLFRRAGLAATAEPRMDAWLRTHAAFEAPLGIAVQRAGSPELLAAEPSAMRALVVAIRRSLNAMPNPAVPRPFALLRALPTAVLVPVFRRFLRSSAAGPLRTRSAAVIGELDMLAEQLRNSASGDITVPSR